MIAGAGLSYFLGPASAIVGILLGLGLMAWGILARSEDVSDAHFFGGLAEIRSMQRAGDVSASVEQAPSSTSAPATESWAYLYNERKRAQEELDELELGPKPPHVPIDAPMTVRLATRAEIHQEQERQRKIERKKQELKLLDERLAPASGDPRIYPEVEDRTVNGGFFAGTVFILQNHGGDVAHKCSIEPMVLSTGRVTFEVVDTIPIGIKVEVSPNVENAGVLQHHDIKAPLRKEWDKGGEATSEFFKKLRMVYEDFRERKFETSFELVYYPVLDIARQARRNAALDKAAPVLRVRNVKIRRIA